MLGSQVFINLGIVRIDFSRRIRVNKAENRTRSKKSNSKYE